MRYSSIYPKTRRQNPADAPSPGTRLLIRAGFISQVASGLWTMTPLGLAVRRQVERVVREEMERINAIELELPILQPRSLWEETGRWAKYKESNTSFRLTDRKETEFLLAPTAEEVITDFARANLPGHNNLPITFWQMSPKFRDELRPRQGLIRGREFVMKDAYSFGRNAEDMRAEYAAMEEAYRRIFTRCGLNFIMVEADSGSIGGSGSAEFMAVTDVGEDVLLHCPVCNYGGNQEKTSAYLPPFETVAERPLERISTPDIKTVQQLEDALGFRADQMAKTIVLVADGAPVIVTMRGDLEISEFKLANLMAARDVGTADEATVRRVTGAPVGFAGPIGLYGKTDVPYFFDRSVEGLQNFLCGGNELDAHYINVNVGRDIPAITEFHDLSKTVAGQLCPSCKTNELAERKGVELGHIFQLQQVYSESMDAVFVDDEGKRIPYWMGCYGVGVSRIVQTIAEQSYDDRGILWPWPIAPYQVCVIPAVPGQFADAENVYADLRSRGWRVMFDDRDARIGEKFTDAELLGYPVQVVVGRTWSEQKKLEVRLRDSRDTLPREFLLPNEKSLPTASMTLDELYAFCTSLDEASSID